MTIKLLKLSGAEFALDHEAPHEAPEDFLPLSPANIDRYAKEIVGAHESAGGTLKIVIVVGGGNIWRGGSGVASDMDRVEADEMGMLATIINGLALRDALVRNGAQDPRTMSAMPVPACEPWITKRARKHLDRDRIIVCVAGTGNPFCTTDTAAVLRARGTKATIILKATNVDGVYDKDPHVHADAVRFTSLSHQEAIDKGLKVMDQTAFTDAINGRVPICVFDASVHDNIRRALLGEKLGTLIHP